MFAKKFNELCDNQEDDFLEALVNKDHSFSIITANNTLDHEVDFNNYYNLEKHWSEWFHNRPK